MASMQFANRTHQRFDFSKPIWKAFIVYHNRDSQRFFEWEDRIELERDTSTSEEGVFHLRRNFTLDFQYGFAIQHWPDGMHNPPDYLYEIGSKWNDKKCIVDWRRGGLLFTRLSRICQRLKALLM